MKKYKLLKVYPGSPKEVGTIVRKLISVDDFPYYCEKGGTMLDVIPPESVENQPKYWQKLKSLFWCEDFKDGSFPEKCCDTCSIQGRNHICSEFCDDEFYNWQDESGCTELKGEPIYEGDKCWTVHHNSDKDWFLNHKTAVDISRWRHCYHGIKCFSNKDNAKIYFNKLKWKDKLKFKIGDVMKCGETIGKVKGLDYLNELYEIKFEALSFEYQHKYCLYETKFKIGKWYKIKSETTPGIAFICYQGAEEHGYGFDHSGVYCTEYTSKYRKHLTVVEADKNKVKELLLNEAKKRYPIGTKFKSVCDNEFLGRGCTVGDSGLKSGNNVIFAYSFEFVYENGKWAEIIEPKFTTADGVEKYIGDKYNIYWKKTETIGLGGTVRFNDEFTESEIHIYFHSLENAQLYHLKQIKEECELKFPEGVKYQMGDSGAIHESSGNFEGMITETRYYVTDSGAVLWRSDTGWIAKSIKNLDFKVTVEYTCKDVIDRKTMEEEYCNSSEKVISDMIEFEGGITT